jgi:hypothetical protein
MREWGRLSCTLGPLGARLAQNGVHALPFGALDDAGSREVPASVEGVRSARK